MHHKTANLILNVTAFIRAAVLFLPLFVFLPKLILWMMMADAAIELFGKNEHAKKVFWIFVRRDGRPGAGAGADHYEMLYYTTCAVKGKPRLSYYR